MQAGLKGRLSLDSVSLAPNPRLNGPGWLNQALGVVSTLPVTALAFVCHYNVHPLVNAAAMHLSCRTPAHVAFLLGLHLHPAGC